MKRNVSIVLFLISVIVIAAFSQLISQRTPEKAEEGVELNPIKILSFSQSAEEVPLYSRFEITLQVNASFANPFNSKEIDIFAIFESESGSKFGVPTFYYQDYNRSYMNGEVLKPIGKLVWKIRFTPFEIGKYTFNITARNSKYSDSVSGSFNAILSNKSGFVRVCNEDKRIANPKLTAEQRELVANAVNINNSDVDLASLKGKR